MSVLLGFVISKSQPFLDLINYLFKPGVFNNIVQIIEPIFALMFMIIKEFSMPFVITYDLTKLTVILIFEIITPVFVFIVEIVKIKWSLVKLLLYLPSISLLKILLMIKEFLLAIIYMLKQILSVFNFIKRILIPTAKATYENKDTTMTFF